MLDLLKWFEKKVKILPITFKSVFVRRRLLLIVQLMKRLIVWKFWPSRCRLVKYFCWRVINTQGYFKYHQKKNGSEIFKMSLCDSIFSNLSWITSGWYKMVHTILFLWSLKFFDCIFASQHTQQSIASMSAWKFLQSAGSGLNPQVDKIVWVEYFRLEVVFEYFETSFDFRWRILKTFGVV